MWIEQLENGKFKYFERYKDAAGRIKKVSVTLEKDTDQVKNKAQRLLYDRIQVKLQAREIKDAKFWDIEKNWYEIAEKTNKPSTMRSKNTAKNHLKKYIEEETLLTEITRSFVHDLLEERYYKKNLSFSSVNSDKIFISEVFNYAIGKGYNVTNPTEKMVLKKKQETLEEREKRRDKYLEQDELEEVISLASQLKNKQWANIIEFLSLTGLRIGELSGLKVKNIQEDRIIIEGTYDRQSHVKVTPKNKYSSRVVTLPKKAIEIMQFTLEDNIRNQRTRGSLEDYVFVTRNGAPIVDSSMNRVLKQLDYKKKPLTSHIFRHTHIALLTELGVPLKAIMERVGHSNPNTTLSIYSHVTKKIEQSVIDKLDTLNL